MYMYASLAVVIESACYSHHYGCLQSSALRVPLGRTIMASR
jgi:hypothetical protein